MNYKYIFCCLYLLLTPSLGAQWEAQGNRLKTVWADSIDVDNPLKEYPRPIMRRSDWINLNGLWDFAILPCGSLTPTKLTNRILVPFPVESSLSGVMERVSANQEIWYSRAFAIPEGWNGKDIILHFGAVDWKTDVWLNDVKIGSHTGGYTPFSFDITPFLTEDSQLLTVRVWDPTDEGPQPRGKQVKDPKGIWYTPVTGIWQTVWLEPVDKSHIKRLRITPDLDRNAVTIKAEVSEHTYGDILSVDVLDGASVIASARAAVHEGLEIVLPDPKQWSPESPFLYDLRVKLITDGATVDEATSYFAMRKISQKRDDHGIMRMQLNNKDYFHFGTLDQGWWPDGLYTAPTDEALKYDVVKTKDLGFNTIRKHVKVEPARWYTHCDRIGMLVWQDMPNGDRDNGWQGQDYFTGSELVRTEESEKVFRKEWTEIMDYLYSYPSIVVWVPFNEAWGQFKTVEITEWTKNHDPTRLVNSASGGNHFQTGDMLDLHNYPAPKLYLYDANRINVLGEYGGIGLALTDHLWELDGNWGYIKFKNSLETTDEYIKYAQLLKKLVATGFSAAIYTQTTDVEGEVNGFMTYDRKVDKMNVAEVRRINREVIEVINR